MKKPNKKNNDLKDKYSREIVSMTDDLKNGLSVSEFLNQNPKHSFMKELQIHIYNNPCNYFNLSPRQMIKLKKIIEDKLKRNRTHTKFIDIDKIRYKQKLCRHINCKRLRVDDSPFCNECIHLNSDGCNHCKHIKEGDIK